MCKWGRVIRLSLVHVFTRDYMPHASADGVLREANPNTFGMLESIVCSRAKIFAGTFFSTFTGYIHRLRGLVRATVPWSYANLTHPDFCQVSWTRRGDVLPFYGTCLRVAASKLEWTWMGTRVPCRVDGRWRRDNMNNFFIKKFYHSLPHQFIDVSEQLRHFFLLSSGSIISFFSGNSSCRKYFIFP